MTLEMVSAKFVQTTACARKCSSVSAWNELTSQIANMSFAPPRFSATSFENECPTLPVAWASRPMPPSA